jgi:hypothetical protein
MTHGGVAQLVERALGKSEVAGSIPAATSILVEGEKMPTPSDPQAPSDAERAPIPWKVDEARNVDYIVDANGAHILTLHKNDRPTLDRIVSAVNLAPKLLAENEGLRKMLRALVEAEDAERARCLDGCECPRCAASALLGLSASATGEGAEK